jgi:hypothetical protein
MWLVVDQAARQIGEDHKRHHGAARALEGALEEVGLEGSDE